MSPGAGGVAGLVLAPGASAGRDQPALVALDRAVTPLGISVERIDFPYRLAGRRAPDPAKVLVATVRQAAEDLAARLGVPTRRIAVGGRSMGGRMGSVAAAEGLAVAGLVLISYPLHPPGRPDRLRVEHFGRLDVPCLFVSGARDAFASVEELERETAAIPGPVETVWIDGGDHSLRGKDEAVVGAVTAWLARLPRRRR